MSVLHYFFFFVVSLHYGNLIYFISVRHSVMWVCNFVMPMLYFVMSFFYVLMWTNSSIISVTATPVGNCICRYQSETSRDRNPEQDFEGRLYSIRPYPTLPNILPRPSMFPPVATRPHPTYLPYPAVPYHTLARKMSESLGEGRMMWSGLVEFGGTGRSSLGWGGVGWGGVLVGWGGVW